MKELKELKLFAFPEIISKNLRKYGKEAGISQKQLADLSGIDIRQISKMENHSDHISTRTVPNPTKTNKIKQNPQTAIYLK